MLVIAFARPLKYFREALDQPIFINQKYMIACVRRCFQAYVRWKPAGGNSRVIDRLDKINTTSMVLVNGSVPFDGFLLADPAKIKPAVQCNARSI